MADDDARKLFVAGLSDSVGDDALRQVFLATGATQVEVNVPRDRATGRPRGFAFVTLGSAEEAANARKVLDGSLQAGRPIAVRPFRADGPGGREDRSSGGGDGHSSEEKTLYIRNLPYESTRDEIIELFKSYGVEGVERVHLPVGPDGRGKGFGFVTMSSPSSAQAALPALRNATLRGRPIAANIARAREDRPSSAPSGPPMSRGPSEFPPPSRGGGEWRPEGRRDSRRFDNNSDESPPGEDELPAASPGGESRNKDKKKKKGGGSGADSPRNRRRQDEGFRSPRGRAQIDDWDDD
jgi:RNA recognition motif-containing protein